MSHVFISYSSINAAYANRLADQLLGEGFNIWIDQERLDASQNWWREIVKAIRTADAVVVILTPESLASNWVEKEILVALKWDKPIFPLHLSGNASDWDIFVNVQIHDGTTGQLPQSRFLEALERASPIQAAKGNMVTASEAQLSPQDSEEVEKAVEEGTPAPDPQPRKRNRLQWVVGAIAILIIIAFALQQTMSILNGASQVTEEAIETEISSETPMESVASATLEITEESVVTTGETLASREVISTSLNGSNLRSEPSTNRSDTIVATVMPNTPLDAVAYTGNLWVLVRIPDQDRAIYGWIGNTRLANCDGQSDETRCWNGLPEYDTIPDIESRYPVADSAVSLLTPSDEALSILGFVEITSTWGRTRTSPEIATPENVLTFEFYTTPVPTSDVQETLQQTTYATRGMALPVLSVSESGSWFEVLLPDRQSAWIIESQLDYVNETRLFDIRGYTLNDDMLVVAVVADQELPVHLLTSLEIRQNNIVVWDTQKLLDFYRSWPPFTVRNGECFVFIAGDTPVSDDTQLMTDVRNGAAQHPECTSNRDPRWIRTEDLSHFWDDHSEVNIQIVDSLSLDCVITDEDTCIIAFD